MVNLKYMRMSCFPSVHNLYSTGHVCDAESVLLVSFIACFLISLPKKNLLPIDCYSTKLYITQGAKGKGKYTFRCVMSGLI